MSLFRLGLDVKTYLIFKKKILKSNAYEFLSNKSWEQDNIIDYVKKGLTDDNIEEPGSISRMLFLVNVIDFEMQRNGFNKSILISKKRAWFELYKEYADEYNIKIFETNNLIFTRFNIKKIIRNYPFLYKLIKNYKYRTKINFGNDLNSSNIKLFIDGRGDISLSNDGLHSDFFWQKNSDFLLKYILYEHCSSDEEDYFKQNGLFSIGKGVYSDNNYLKKYSKPNLNFSNEFREEYEVLKSILNSYNIERQYSESFFKMFDVKIFLTWDKYSNKHIALSDGIKNNGGISVNWQMAFDGFCNMECLINSDIVFSYSKFSTEIEKKLKSKIKYNVIVGYLKDYAPALLRDKADLVRAKLEANGAKKIVFVIDENSNDDSRWHTGHELQRENYSYILEKLFEEPWLGVLFKPKNIYSLRQRLGQTAELLDRALATGRCYIFEDGGRHTTSAPPILAGLASDVCIHGHLNAGTAALECALEGLPTLLIDREGAPYSKLYELPKDKVVFQDWPSAIDALMEHFNSSDGIPDFGDWSSIIDELDPFRDGMAANRMGNYLKLLIDGYDKGIERDEVMAKAAELYAEKWGSDKIVIS